MHKLLARNIYVLLCRDFTQDSLDMMGSILKIIENFSVEIKVDDLNKDGKELGKDLLNIPTNYMIATSWSLGEPLKKDSSVAISANIFDSEDTNLGGPSQEIKIQKGLDRVNMNFAVNGLPLKNHGDYRVEASLTLNGETIKATYPFKVFVKTIES